MMNFEIAREAFSKAGQGHVFEAWEGLDPEGRRSLLSHAAEVDLDELRYLIRDSLEANKPLRKNFRALNPPPFIAHPRHGGDREAWNAAGRVGKEVLREGKVAAFTVAGGEGTRLGYEGPKGTFPVTPVKGKSLFQVFAEKISAASQIYGTKIPWFIMTSVENYRGTVDFFRENRYFGLFPDSLNFFPQGRMPAVDFDGKIILDGPNAIVLSPDGHGGAMRAMAREGALQTMREAGIEVISYFQVDNPLVKAIDPPFIGFHYLRSSEMSSKMVFKSAPEEKIGVFCREENRIKVIEYSDLPEAAAETRDRNGRLQFRHGSIAVHLLSLDFVERVGGGSDASYRLPFHPAKKKIARMGQEGEKRLPEHPNGVKFEMFVFDALPFASNPVIVETLREEEFSPLKNAEGPFSLRGCREDQIRLWTRWLRSASLSLPADESGLPPFSFEISPLFAPDENSFLRKWESLRPKPDIREGTFLEIEGEKTF